MNFIRNAEKQERPKERGGGVDGLFIYATFIVYLQENDAI